jgi:hypothetical protein
MATQESTGNGRADEPQTDMPPTGAEQSPTPGSAGARGRGRPWQPWSSEGYELTDYSGFKIGDLSPFNTRIERVFGRGRDFLVYAHDSGQLAMHFNEPLPDYMRPAIQEHRRLTNISSIALDRVRREKARDLIGSGLTHAFTATAADEVRAGMEPAKAFVESRAADRARSNFLLIVTACAVVVFAGLCYLKYVVLPAGAPTYLRALALGSMGGIVGSTISWIERCGDVEVNLYASWPHRTFHGAMRVMLGMVFGAIVVIVAESQFAFSIATKSSYALCLMALAAGFSERLVPDVISGVAQQQRGADTPPAS